MYYVYILRSLKYHKSYVGTTDNILRRLKDHNAGKTIYSKRYKPWKIIYQEKFETLSGARKREKYFKSGAGRKLMKQIFKDYSRVV